MSAPSQPEPSSPSSQTAPSQLQKPRNIVAPDQQSFLSLQQRPAYQNLFDREREQSTGGWSASSVGTGGSGPSSSAHRTLSKRFARGVPSALGGPGMGKKRDKHSLALLSIRHFLKGRSCYDCLPVSFRLVVLDTKLVVKPALEVMWQAGIVSAPLWQSTSSQQPQVDPSSASAIENTLSPSALSAKIAASELSDSPGPHRSPPPSGSSDDAGQGGMGSPSLSTLLSEANNTRGLSQSSALPPSKAGFAGMLTVNDIIHLIQYYYKHSSYDNAAQDVERFRLEMLREIEQTLHVPQPPLISIEPLRPLFDACQLLIKTHARRLPLLDYDEQTGMETVVSVLTQYRVLKFIAMNCRETAGLNRTLRSLGIGTYVAGFPGVGRTSISAAGPSSARGSISSSRRSSNTGPSGLVPPSSASGMSGEGGASSLMATAEALPVLEEDPQSHDSPAFSPSPHFFPGRTEGTLQGSQIKYDPIATATLDTTVFDVVHIFSEKGISAVPILDEDGYVVDMYETVDVIDLVRSGAYQSLDLTIRQALSKRSKEFPGVMTCGPDDTLATIFTLLRTKRVHRLLILEPEAEEPLAPFDVEEQTGPAGNKPNDPLAGLGEVKNRNRGRLVGILCLSDILRYIIGGKANMLGNPSGSGVNPSATTSAMGDAETASGGAVPAEVEDRRNSNASREAAVPETAANDSGPRPVEIQPTIAEHPKEGTEIAAPPS